MTGGAGGVPGTIARYLATALLTVVAVVLLLVTCCGGLVAISGAMEFSLHDVVLGLSFAVGGALGVYAVVAVLRLVRPRATPR